MNLPFLTRGPAPRCSWCDANLDVVGTAHRFPTSVGTFLMCRTCADEPILDIGDGGRAYPASTRLEDAVHLGAWEDELRRLP